MILGTGFRDIVSPYNPECNNTCSYDLHIGDEFLQTITARIPKELYTDSVKYSKYLHEFVLKSRMFALCTTEETIHMPQSKCGMILSTSTVDRFGLQIQAGIVDSGFKGQLTLGLFNRTKYPMKLISGMKICQLIVHDVKAYKHYDGHYQHQTGAAPPFFFENGKK